MSHICMVDIANMQTIGPCYHGFLWIVGSTTSEWACGEQMELVHNICGNAMAFNLLLGVAAGLTQGIYP